MAWRIHPDDVVRFAAEGKHCETRRCRNPIAVVAWRWWRSAAAGRVLVSEHFVCDQHGQEFAERHGMQIDPPSEHEARRLTAAEAAALAAEGRHCGAAACQNPATCVFTERYTTRGEPRADEDLSCDEHAAMFAARLGIAAVPDDGGA